MQVDLDDEFLDLFYNITNSPKPKVIDLIALKTQLINIVDTLKELNSSVKKPIRSKALGNCDETPTTNLPAILMVDDLGVITYQLKVLMDDYECEVDCSQEIYDAVNKFKAKKYSYVIMDLFIPTEREGFILLTELKKMINKTGQNTIIGVITASPRKEIEQQCKQKGADFFLEKNNDWQTKLREILLSYLETGEYDEVDDVNGGAEQSF
ncbi:MAG: response regulator [bacterium]|nr:response regulator [bacterium]